MALEKDKEILQQDIIDRFEDRVGNWVNQNINITPDTQFTKTARVSRNISQWGNGVRSTWEGSYTVGSYWWYYYTKEVSYTGRCGTIAANSTSNGGSYNSTLSDSIDTHVVDKESFSADVGVKGKVGHMAEVIKQFLKEYSKVHRAQFVNHGNVGFSAYSGVIASSNESNSATSNMENDVDNAIQEFQFKSGMELKPDTLLQLIERCRTIWKNRCVNSGNLETFKYNYCHNSCHSNRTCYNSRGRR